MSQPTSQERMEAKRDRLYEQLEKGYANISKALEEGKPVKEWEDFWVTLLREYERVCDELQRDLAI